ncbi:uncharacterized protein LOC111578961 isoform X2 [Amphiprion ocellaris]|uniref:uncharacterized protein LOC111578961 isoform X2 n=1 Tax=Amphiprion ocellaris TaxID=80972 RepID=UPI00164A0AE4|nr:uncharacterized protein LOC111578961 isoform X2 [Amphiprion ocellaris]
MEDFCRHLGINGTLTLICCIFCIFLPEGKAAWETISENVGSRVTLQCSNESISTLNQLTWKMNGVTMFTFNPLGNFYVSPQATNLTLKMSESQSQLYALIIENAQLYHTGNYTCEVTSMKDGVLDQNWRLIIKESTEIWDILMIATVSSVCLLIFLIGLVILIRCNKRHTRNSRPSTSAEAQPTEDIYENCLEIERYNRRHSQPNKPLPIQHRV